MEFPNQVELSDTVLFQEIEGESVLLNMANERYYGLDSVGTRFWKLLSESGDTSVVMDALMSEFEVDESKLRLDIEHLIRDLNSEGLVRIRK